MTMTKNLNQKKDMELGKIIKKIRTLRKMTLQQVCEQGNYEFTPSQLSKIERDYSAPSFRLVCLIANALNISMDVFDGRVRSIEDINTSGENSVFKGRVVELIEWDAVPERFGDLKSKEDINKEDKVFIPAPGDIPGNCTAIKIIGDAMESFNAGVSFPKGGIIFADPNLEEKENDFVLVKTKDSVMFRQLKFSESGKVLVPLNRQYPVTNVEPGFVVLAVVISLQVELVSNLKN